MLAKQDNPIYNTNEQTVKLFGLALTWNSPVLLKNMKLILEMISMSASLRLRSKVAGSETLAKELWISDSKSI